MCLREKRNQVAPGKEDKQVFSMIKYKYSLSRNDRKKSNIGVNTMLQCHITEFVS